MHYEIKQMKVWNKIETNKKQENIDEGKKVQLLEKFLFTPIATINAMTQSNLGKKRLYLAYPSMSPALTQKAGKEFKACTQELKQKPEEYCLLACSPWFPQLSVLYSSGLTAQGWHCLQWVGCTFTNEQS